MRPDQQLRLADPLGSEAGIAATQAELVGDGVQSLDDARPARH